MRHPFFRTGHISSARVEAFSDGVMAVAITLLVLEVKVPAELRAEKELWMAVGHVLPALRAWAVSFAFVLTFWVNHNYFFASLKHTDRGLLWLNGLFLLTVNLIPFPTAMVGEYPAFTAPLALLSGTMMATSLSFAVMRLYASYHGQLLRDHIDSKQAKRGMIQSGVAPALYAVAVAVAFVWPPGSIAIQIGVLVLFFLRSPIRHVNDERAIER